VKEGAQDYCREIWLLVQNILAIVAARTAFKEGDLAVTEVGSLLAVHASHEGREGSLPSRPIAVQGSGALEKRTGAGLSASCHKRGSVALFVPTAGRSKEKSAVDVKVSCSLLEPSIHLGAAKGDKYIQSVQDIEAVPDELSGPSAIPNLARGQAGLALEPAG